MRNLLFTAIVCFIPSCVSTSSVGRPETIDVAVTTDPRASVALILYRNRSDPWQAPEATGGGHYIAHDVDNYEVLVVFDDPWGGIDAVQSAATAANGPELTIGTSLVSQSFTLIGGQMVQPGNVALDHEAQANAAAGSFLLASTAGTHTLLASSGGRVALQRGFHVPAQTKIELPAPIDVANGAPLVPVSVNAEGASTPLQASMQLLTGNDVLNVTDWATETIFAVPPALLVAGDTQRALVQTYVADDCEDEPFQSATAPYDGKPLALNMMPVIGSDQVTASYAHDTSETTLAGLPDRTTRVEIVVSSSQLFGYHRFIATSEWLAANGTTNLGVDTTAPQFQADWKYGAPLVTYVQLDDNSGPISYASGAYF
jgi:hypothetical protein